MRPADEPSEAPLADDELDALFAPLADARLIALAVSGGADSLALLDAVERWPKRQVPAIVLTVDHGLRRGSRIEANRVAGIARRRGMEARVLAWKGPRPQSDIEGAARAARYRLLLEACRLAGASHLLLAHHQGDLAETFLLRLKRGGGVFGLAAMRPWLDLGDIVIVRPFLGLPRARLAATTAAAKLVPVDDPMNADPRFDRARVRRLLPRLAEAVEADEFAVAWLDAARFSAAPHAVRMRALARILIAVGGDDYPPRHERLAALHDAIVARPSRFKRTLAGTIVEARAGRFAFYREMGREELSTIALKPGFRGFWDHRFAVEVGKGAPAGLSLGPLGEAGRREFGPFDQDHPVGAVAALPALRRRGRIVGVAPFSSGFPPGAASSVTVRAILGERLRRPPLFPDSAGH